MNDFSAFIRRADERDMPRISEIRLGVRENILSDHSRVTDADIRWFIDNPGIWLFERDGVVEGFSAGDTRDGGVWALFIEERFEGRGVGRALHDKACDVLRASGYAEIWLTTGPGTRAERFYLRNGWRIAGERGGDLLMKRGFDAA